LQGARPKLTPVIGMLTAGGIVTNDATRDVRDAIRAAAEQLPAGPLVIGVKVVNAGRAPFHVAGWELRADPHGAAFALLDDPIGSPTVPCDILAGAQKTFFMHLDGARALASGCEVIGGKPQRIVVTVSSGGRTYVSKAVEPLLLTLGAE
jgi:NAD(P)-dependent dehydrogenase (short-subunit alcohol dehydrogenase family)